MLRIAADLFSGRPNPVWTVDDEARVRETLRALSQEESLLTEDVPPNSGLGFRGFRIQLFSDELAQGFELGSSVYLPVGRESRGPRSDELGERLIGLLGQEGTSVRMQDELPPLEAPLQQFLTTELDYSASQSFTAAASVPDIAGEQPEEAAPQATCFYEHAPYNPGFWNNDSTVRWCNNCYNYASNWRTDNFAQPGLGCGSVYQALRCDEVTRAARCDGVGRRYIDCFPDPEKPRWLIALVVGPGYDYHWYRYVSDGFWGHKPGATAVTNLDNSNVVIKDPKTANRGRYTDFCGYFYSCRTQQRRIRGYGC
ncbi:hypothetical protein LX15_003518 [Streptoalloteichus tenebrarius]|uniref:Uncharacterized protein n=1 Tax=Streptoalloteichus tenebrarius (strain ATCC 17920 / DSM 40477 / JCM 4838 / CBS 697.72 / NBRC 16177 / NCIMB 11028 / NRRL B-12390 / A12253. 1 / ISP 5477) TaxID=1933 RepID=A0ABT1HWC0_STRSD|nr:hypothetical protein [Streptoalloteichus tenebrarius]MCP2259809.1 hypothetical protein [Streptoalloteichus tenebrarius]BFE99244.1 hypothetical protein GCM10020241_09200 [Streptoalloteichus tenebrarius]